MTVKLVVAHDDRRGIGRGGDMPWHVPGEMRWLAKTTRTTTHPDRRNALIMGLTTYYSIPAQRRPLGGRTNIVVSSREPALEAGAIPASDLDIALKLANHIDNVEDIYIFGGASVYEQAIDQLIPEELLVTVIPGDFGCDRFFPEIPTAYRRVSSTPAEYDTITACHDIYVRA
ncbi:MAG: dihydrofolate reductase [Mycobacterium sp.]|nr:dihydrofolate reductase [Mycobacterium sp.]